MPRAVFFILRPFVLIILCVPLLVRAAEDFSVFEKTIRPLLVERCYECHSAGHKIKGGLRLDTRDGWQTGGDTGPAILPGKPDDSLLIKAISYHDRDLKMPPKQQLSDSDKAAFREWITSGAPDPRTDAGADVATAVLKKLDTSGAKAWWSFKPIRKPSVPAVKDASWPRNPIDHFILAKLEANKLTPSPDATPEVLKRRLHFDLTGLPPAIKPFNSELQTPNSELIERLLASPQFAERWASHWLDITRFAESSGGGRTLPFKDAWRYRDYVIESLRDNVPLDRFITEQLAGDLLPHANVMEQRKLLTATGFLALGPTNYEEQDKQMLRMDIVDEQLETMGRAFLGMTIGCARCHDHKFDPILQRDYYALAGILLSTRTIKSYTENVAHWIDTPLPMDGDVEAELQAKEAKLTLLKQELASAKEAAKKAGVDIAVKNLKPGALAVSKLDGIVVDDADAKRIGFWKQSKYTHTYIGEGYLSDNNEDKGAKTLTFMPKITAGGNYEVRFAYSPLENRATDVPVVIFHADGESSMKVDESLAPPIDDRFVSLGTYRFEANGEGYILISNTDTKGYVTADAVQFLKVDDNAIAKTPAKQEPSKKVSASKVKTETNRVAALDKEIKTLEAKGPKRPEAMSVREDDAIEDSPIHIRGQVRILGEVVPRGFLSVVSKGAPTPPKDQSGRRELAQWIMGRDNPLTARVLANRVWLWLTGEGLVRTPDNFGTTGEAPTHPELLDWLANELVESGWDLKHLVTLIVSSRTYQQTSNPEVGMRNAESQTISNSIDPENRLYWRANRRRLDAECIRDTMLSVSGQLDAKVGGPGIVDAKAIDQNTSSAQTLEYDYKFTDSRRSLYTPAFRNKRQELFEAFDFADINQTVGKRNASTVAPQALFMLNHPFVIEQSRKAAEALLGSTTENTDDTERVKRAYDLVLGRKPTARELQLAADFVQVSAGDVDRSTKRVQNWALFVQTLFASAEFRYLK